MSIEQQKISHNQEEENHQESSEQQESDSFFREKKVQKTSNYEKAETEEKDQKIGQLKKELESYYGVTEKIAMKTGEIIGRTLYNPITKGGFSVLGFGISEIISKTWRTLKYIAGEWWDQIGKEIGFGNFIETIKKSWKYINKKEEKKDK